MYSTSLAQEQILISQRVFRKSGRDMWIRRTKQFVGCGARNVRRFTEFGVAWNLCCPLIWRNSRWQLRCSITPEARSIAFISFTNSQHYYKTAEAAPGGLNVNWSRHFIMFNNTLYGWYYSDQSGIVFTMPFFIIKFSIDKMLKKLIISKC
jgi:hypothetical protein